MRNFYMCAEGLMLSLIMFLLCVASLKCGQNTYSPSVVTAIQTDFFLSLVHINTHFRNSMRFLRKKLMGLCNCGDNDIIKGDNDIIKKVFRLYKTKLFKIFM